jgi:hypothetical protein
VGSAGGRRLASQVDPRGWRVRHASGSWSPRFRPAGVGPAITLE